MRTILDNWAPCGDEDHVIRSKALELLLNGPHGQIVLEAMFLMCLFVNLHAILQVKLIFSH